MNTRLERSLAVVGLASVSALLSGCGGPNLIDRFNNFAGYGICSAIVVILDVIALVEIYGSSRSTGDKIIWTLVIIFLPILGCIIYWVFARR